MGVEPKCGEAQRLLPKAFWEGGLNTWLRVGVFEPGFELLG
jgi:hypothetical protein